jgi:CheY-like chemotaxis protein
MPTVLVVDDDRDICGMAGDALRPGRLRRAAARNGCDALRQLNDTYPAVILLDLMMPVMDGVEFRGRQPRLRDIPLVCLSARHDAGRTALRLGVAGFLSKRFNLDSVIAAVRGLCPA